MRGELFTKEICGWASWSKIFCVPAAFTPLAEHILRSHGLYAHQNPEPMIPGTNAVFHMGDYVMKIFAPEETGLNDLNACKNECRAMGAALKAGVRVPKILATGEVRDKYLFSYMVTEFLPGQAAKDVLPCYNAAQKEEFAINCREITEKLQHTDRDGLAQPDIYARTCTNARWRGLSPALVGELQARASSVARREKLFVHGDLTGENVHILPNGDIAILDFGDALLAPPCYELPPVVFDLFRGDKVMVRRFMGREDAGIFLSDVLAGISVHDFGGDILKDLFARYGEAPDSIRNVADLLTFFHEILC